eukprot:3146004-Rhodomonas_salina.2
MACPWPSSPILLAGTVVLPLLAGSGKFQRWQYRPSLQTVTQHTKFNPGRPGPYLLGSEPESEARLMEERGLTVWTGLG